MTMINLIQQIAQSVEVITLDCKVHDVDPVIIMEMQERLRPSTFSYDKEVQACRSDELERIMRERNKWVTIPK